MGLRNLIFRAKTHNVSVGSLLKNPKLVFNLLFSKKQKSSKKPIQNKPENGLPSCSEKKDEQPSKDICGICMEVAKGHMVMNCSHKFCLDCISKYITTSIEQNTIFIRCPELYCEAKLEPAYIFQNLITSKVFSRWTDALCESLFLDSNKVYCPFNDCSPMILIDDEKKIKVMSTEETKYPYCERMFCIKCKVPWHSEFSCNEFKKLNKMEEDQELMFKKLAEKKQWKKCPMCKFYVEKTSGCSYIFCRCNFQFCYLCGSPWYTRHRHSCSAMERLIGRERGDQ